MALSPEHLSLYSLTVEPGTPLADRVYRHLDPAPDDDLAAELYDLACAWLAAGGYAQYEISNWALHRGQGSGIRSQLPASSFQCRHNLVYWRREPYLGFGAGSHSFAGGRRWWNVRPVAEYIGRIAAGRSAEEGGETIDRRTALGEFMMLGLRLTQEGVADARFRERFGVGLDETFGREIRRLVARGLLERLPDRARLTPAARLLGNRVFGEFVT